MRTKLFTLAVALSLVVPSLARAQSSASSTLTVTASVIKALTLTPTTGTLAFGNVPQNYTKSIDPKGTSAVKFTANGEPNTSVTVTVPGTATLANGGANITYTASVTGKSTDDPSTSTAVVSGNSVTLDVTSGNFYFYVGGSVAAPTGATTGNYSGTWTLTVAYTGI